MSSQSGIIPSDELVSTFHAFLASGNRALVLTIDAKQLTIDITNTIAGSADLGNDLDSLIAQGVINDTECMYLILKYNNDNKFAFISYVPDNAIVRYKMLYASSKNTLLRSLNNEYFNPILFINSPDELSSSGWKKIIAGLNTVALSEDEINFKKSNELNNITTKASASAASILNDSSNSLLFQIDDALVSVLQNSNQLSTLINLEITNEVLRLINKSDNVTLSNLISLVDSTAGPSYHLYTNETGAQFFILTCPSGSKVRDRMLYAANKQGLLNHLKKNGWDFVKVIEAGDADEIELTELNVGGFEDDTPAASNRLRFAKPKGPRRR